MTYSWGQPYGAYAVVAGFGITALPSVVSGWTGWDGNRVIYLTEGILSDHPYKPLTQWANVSQPAGGNVYGVINALGVSVGRPHNYTTGLSFDEYWYNGGSASSSYMLINVPMVAASGSSYYCAPVDFGCVETGTMQQEISLSVTNEPSSGYDNEIQWGDNSGVNVTGSVDLGQNMSQSLWGLGVDAAGFLPGVGFATGGATALWDFEKLQFAGQNYLGPGSPVYEEFNPYGGSDTQDVFISQVYTIVKLYESYWSDDPAIAVTGFNFVGYTSPLVQGARASFAIYAVPAVTLTGQVKAGGNALANAVVNIQATSGPDSGTDFQVTTDPNGNYRFFARVGTTYNVWSILSNAFGTATWTATSPTYSFNDPNPTSQTENVVIPASDVYGTVTDSNTGQPIAGALAQLSNSTGAYENTYTDTNGNYVLWTAYTGTYIASAAAGGYFSSWASVNVGKLSSSYKQNLALTPSVGGCVLSGTLISTSSGAKKVDSLAAGNVILGYNVTNGLWVQETVASNSYSMVNQVLSINGGLLKVTLTDQPLYVRNGTWVGWIHDPESLTAGEQLFNPSTGSWVTITSLQVLQGKFKVYDLRVSSPNDFVANGLLALDKHR